MRMRMRWLLALGTTVIVILLLELIAQLTLPGIAADHIRSQLQKSGRVLDVEVSAFPALELLFHNADSVTVKMASYRSSTAHLSSLLQESNDAGTLHASASVFTDGLLTLHDATLTKHGNVLVGSARVLESDLTHAIPLIKSVKPIASSGGTLTLEGTATLPIVGPITIPFVVQVQNGALIAAPDIPIVGGLATIRLFSNPHVRLQTVSATRTPGGFSVSATGTLT
jgi:hypothetical protein